MSAPPTKPVAQPKTWISWTAMAILTATAVASIRGLPTMAGYGWGAIGLYIIPAIVFMVPVALVAAELASGWKGGVFVWVREAFGDQMGFSAIWQQWIQNVVWYPAQLAFFASALAYVFDPALANSGPFTAIVILVVYWFSTFIATRGVEAFAKVGSTGFLIGTIIPAAGLIVAAALFLGSGGVSNLAPVSEAKFLPAWAGIASIVLIVGNFLSYAGMEMNAVHVTDMKKPGSEFPKAIGLSVILILFVFILPTLAISVAVPASSINLTQGVLQAFTVFFSQLGIPWATSVMALLIVIGVLAAVVTWIPGPSRGLLMVGRGGYLPLGLQKTNQRGMQVNIMVVQGIIVTALAMVYALSPSVQSIFWVFSAMAVQLYLIMYMMMFLAALRLRRDKPDVKRGFTTPAMKFIGGLGFVASLLAFLIGFVEPSGDGIDQLTYTGFLVIGIVGLGIWPFILYRVRRPSWKTDTDDEDDGTHAPEPAGAES